MKYISFFLSLFVTTNMGAQIIKPKSVIRISLCRTAKRNPKDRFGIK